MLSSCHSTAIMTPLRASKVYGSMMTFRGMSRVISGYRLFISLGLPRYRLNWTEHLVAKNSSFRLQPLGSGPWDLAVNHCISLQMLRPSELARSCGREAPKSAPAAVARSRAINPEEKRRQLHNQSIREAAAQSTIARSQFLLKHAEVFEPFLTEKVMSTIRYIWSSFEHCHCHMLTGGCFLGAGLTHLLVQLTADMAWL